MVRVNDIVSREVILIFQRGHSVRTSVSQLPVRAIGMFSYMLQFYQGYHQFVDQRWQILANNKKKLIVNNHLITSLLIII
jgi:hypothetical protein